MLVDIKVPSVGESVTEAMLAQWFKNDGDPVKKDEPLFVIETDKVTLEVVAEAEGILSIKVAEGETVAIGAVVGTIDTETGKAQAEKPQGPAAAVQEQKPTEAEVNRAQEKKQRPAIPSDRPESGATDLKQGQRATPKLPGQAPKKPAETGLLPPSVRRIVAEKSIDPSQVVGTGPGGRVTKSDVILYLESRRVMRAEEAPAPEAGFSPPEKAEARQPEAPLPAAEAITRKPMSPIRRRIAARLLEAKQNTAMLTTFNEIDMAQVTAIRRRYKEAFQEKYGVALGMMSFFIKASIEALKAFPQINSFIEQEDIIEHHYYHIGVAVGSERGLVVPVIRHADTLSFAGIELAIVEFVKKINQNQLALSDLEGGTFTISNGGVYGSLLSTPILNMPQSAILGMHKIEKRPVVIEDAVVIRPMMYVALSYDHRIVDGREAVTFLKRIKACIENPERMLMEI